jgi:hypothetical protein
VAPPPHADTIIASPISSVEARTRIADCDENISTLPDV